MSVPTAPVRMHRGFHPPFAPVSVKTTFPNSQESERTFKLLWDVASWSDRLDHPTYLLGSGLVAIVTKATDKLKFVDLTLIDEGSGEEPELPNVVSGRVESVVFGACARHDSDYPVFINPSSVLSGIAEAVSRGERMTSEEEMQYRSDPKVALGALPVDGLNIQNTQELVANLRMR